MPVTSFFPRPAARTLAEIARVGGGSLPGDAAGSTLIHGVAPLDSAGPEDVSFLDNPSYVLQLEATRAGACFVARKFASRVPAGTVPIVADEPYRAYALAATLLYPAAVRPEAAFGVAGIAPGAIIHPRARVEPGVCVEPGAVIGESAEIGAGAVIGPHAVIGPGVKIGRDCAIGPGASIVHAYLGNRVIVHAGARIGQDGFGFAMGPRGHQKVPQLGRVIIQDDVEIGANSTIDRGATRDTVIGEGTKIDNLVQIAHNVTIGRHCVIVSQVGISGSAVLEDFVVIAGQAGVAGHVRVGAGAQIGAKSGVMHDVPPGARYVGQPAKPARQVFRELALLARLAARDGDRQG